ncbi:hypothetical protein KC19_5G009400 [Ceratodon purpureus]|uniref:Chromatin target of PRMT1 protein C-terminal domain-containing protein n=1 Tax=Ceratodon purpureus TaxID=3225 RepID=A0A8T0HWM0_CERPU|nr:hypothetical protein KC19_5G009400 [Ceratodon purpureus]
MQGQQGRRGGRGGGGGYHYRSHSHGFQPYAAAGGWGGYGGGGGGGGAGGYNHMQHGGGGGGGGGYGPVYTQRGAPRGGILPLGVQGAGILKRPTGPPQGPLLHGRGHQRGGGRGGGRGGRGGRGRGRGGRDKDKDQKPLTKEALDADLDEWRMKDKKNGGTSLDAELDDYWKNNKEDDDPTDKDDGELLESSPAEEPAAPKADTPKSSKLAGKKPTGARTLDRSNGEAPEPSNSGA